MKDVCEFSKIDEGYFVFAVDVKAVRALLSYKKKYGDEAINILRRSAWINNVKQYILDCTDNYMEKVFENEKFFLDIVILIFLIKENLFFVKYVNSETRVLFDATTLGRFLASPSVDDVEVNTFFISIKESFSMKEEFRALTEENIYTEDYSQDMIQDIIETIAKVDSFKINIEGKHGKPMYGKVDFKVKDVKRIEELRKYTGNHGGVYPIGEGSKGRVLEGKKKFKRKKGKGLDKEK